jgi:hypothetical protein
MNLGARPIECPLDRRPTFSKRCGGGATPVSSAVSTRVEQIPSEALSARVIAGGEGGDPRLRGEGDDRKISLDEAPPHPPYAAERESERDV